MFFCSFYFLEARIIRFTCFYSLTLLKTLLWVNAFCSNDAISLNEPVNAQIRTTNGVCVSCGHGDTCQRYLCFVMFDIPPSAPTATAGGKSIHGGKYIHARHFFCDRFAIMPAMLSTLNLTFCATETVVYITTIYASSYNYTTIRSACLSEGGGGLQGLVGSQSV